MHDGTGGAHHSYYVLRLGGLDWVSRPGAFFEAGVGEVWLAVAPWPLRSYDHKGNHDRAITDCTEAIRLNPKLAEAFNNRGLAYDYKGDHDRAIADYTEAGTIHMLAFEQTHRQTLVVPVHGTPDRGKFEKARKVAGGGPYACSLAEFPGTESRRW
jgi:tetratricopeptide (TPR) repeat protein